MDSDIALHSIQNKPPTPVPTPPPPSSYSSSNTTNTITPKHKMLNLWVHNDSFSKQDFILNPDFFPGIKLGQLLEIYNSNEKSDVTRHLIIKVNSLDKEHIGKEKPILQVINNLINIFLYKFDSLSFFLHT